MPNAPGAMTSPPDNSVSEWRTLHGVEWPLPDVGCLEAGDDQLMLAVRCFAAAGLCDADIATRLRDVAADLLAYTHTAAVEALAAHYAWAGATFLEIIDVLVWLAAEAPAWPDNPDEIAFIARRAIAEADQ